MVKNLDEFMDGYQITTTSNEKRSPSKRHKQYADDEPSCLCPTAKQPNTANEKNFLGK